MTVLYIDVRLPGFGIDLDAVKLHPSKAQKYIIARPKFPIGKYFRGPDIEARIKGVREFSNPSLSLFTNICCLSPVVEISVFFFKYFFGLFSKVY